MQYRVAERGSCQVMLSSLLFSTELRVLRMIRVFVVCVEFRNVLVSDSLVGGLCVCVCGFVGKTRAGGFPS
jgi:hypothetical protein